MTHITKYLLFTFILCFSMVNVHAQANTETGEVINAMTDIGWKDDLPGRYPAFGVANRAPVIAKEKGEVFVRFQVKPNGEVGLVIPLQTLDNEVEQEVIRTVSEWRFAPLFSDDPQVNSWGVVRLNKQGADQVRHDEDEYFVVVEQMPELLGGVSNLQDNFYLTNMCSQIMGREQYKNSDSKRVTIQFIVNTEGKPEKIRLSRGSDFAPCNESALLTTATLRFIPGRQKGEPVRVQYSLPVVFR